MYAIDWQTVFSEHYYGACIITIYSDGQFSYTNILFHYNNIILIPSAGTDNKHVSQVATTLYYNIVYSNVLLCINILSEVARASQRENVQ